MTRKPIPFFRPSVDDEEIEEVVDTIRSGWLTTGPKTEVFERELAAYVGAEEVLATSSCTGALHASLLSLGVGPGDTVVSTPMTFCASVQVIEQVGATPLLVDIEADTLCIDPNEVQRVVKEDGRSSPIRCILPVHIHGHPADLPALYDIAASSDLSVVEDAAHALAAAYDGTPIGTTRTDVRNTACYSFYVTKNLTTGEGGALAGSSEVVAEAREWALHGVDHGSWVRHGAGGRWNYDIIKSGFKYNMSDLQAAMGLRQLRKLPALQVRRQAIAARYNDAFAAMEEVEGAHTRDGVTHAWHLYPLRLNLDRLSITRDQFIAEMTARQIGCSLHFIPLHLFTYFKERYGYQPEDFPVATREFYRLVSLPLYPAMTDDDVDGVIEAVQEIVAANRK